MSAGGRRLVFAALLISLAGATCATLAVACTFALPDVVSEGSDGAAPSGTAPGLVPPNRPPPGVTPPIAPPPPGPAPDSGIVSYGALCTCAAPDPKGGACEGSAVGCGWDLSCVYYAGMSGRGECVGKKCCDDSAECEADAGSRKPCAQGTCKSGRSLAGIGCYALCGEKYRACGFDSSFCTPCAFGMVTEEQLTCLRHKACAEFETPSMFTIDCPKADAPNDFYCR